MTKKLPAFQFYPGDWMKDPALRACTYAAKGLWIDMLCLMYESDRRGVLQLSDGAAVTPAQIARMTGGTTREVEKLIAELESAGVCGRDGGSLTCRRMIRDEARRVQAIEDGKRGGNPILKGGDNPPDKPTSTTPDKPKGGSSSSSSFSSSPSGEKPAAPPDGFVEFWNEWPKSDRKQDRAKCEKFWQDNRLSDRWSSEIRPGLSSWKKSNGWTKDNGEYIPAPLVWLRNARWQEGPAAAPSAAPVRPVDPERAEAAKWYLTLTDEQKREASGVVNIDQWADIARKGVVSDPILASWRASKTLGVET